MTITSVKRALISVSDKTGLVDFAMHLVSLGVEIISTGGTSLLLHEANITHQKLEEITGFPELFDGRVKSLHPILYGGILGKRDTHAAHAAEHGINWIDLVVANFYPFSKMIQQNELAWSEAVEYIDIGGPTMVRAAAKNFAWVGTIVDPLDYVEVIDELKKHHGLSSEIRKKWAQKAFALTAAYDAVIHQYFLEKTNDNKEVLPASHFQLDAPIELRYGENPHQKAFAYPLLQDTSGALSAIKHQGKTLSFNNLLDADAAWLCVNEFDVPACAIIKHTQPCGVATDGTIEEAFIKAYQADSLSAFGGIVAINKRCTKKLAEVFVANFFEILLAPSFNEDALTILKSKSNLRVLTMQETLFAKWEMKFISGSVLVQERDTQSLTAEDLKIVTHAKPDLNDRDSMLFSWRVLKHIKSNAILLSKDQCTAGIGAGQVSRVDAVDLALRKAGEKTRGAILASDAFFPFRDSIDRLSNQGIRAIIQPGGSLRDEEVISACNEYGIAMAFTGKRCFKH